MDFSFFPENYQKSLDNVNLSKLYEIRLRLNFPVKINVDGINLYLCENGGTFFKNNALICEKTDIEHVIKQVTENSFYAFNENIKNAFLTTKSGFRIGLAGECVFENENVQTIKNISSLNIRISHEIIGCSNNLIPYIINNDNFLNSLIIV